MTRSASPNGAIEFSYDFPVASTSALPIASYAASSRSSRAPRRKPAPVRPRWEDPASDLDDDDDRERDYAALGYPTAPRRTLTVPVPIRTGNQWRAPSPTHHNPYASAYDYAYAAPLASSCESTSSVLSAASKRNHCHIGAKIRKPRRSVDEIAPPSPSPLARAPSPPGLTPPALSYSTSASSSSAPSSPYSAPEDDFSDADDEGDDDEQDEQEKDTEKESATPHAHAHMALRRQWAALSLRVRFGVFRAKRRMRNRVMSL